MEQADGILARGKCQKWALKVRRVDTWANMRLLKPCLLQLLSVMTILDPKGGEYGFHCFTHKGNERGLRGAPRYWTITSPMFWASRRTWCRWPLSPWSAFITSLSRSGISLFFSHVGHFQRLEFPALGPLASSFIIHIYSPYSHLIHLSYLLEDINPLLGHILENWRNALPDKYVLSHQGCPTCGPRDACSPGWLWLQPDTKSWIYLKH